MPYIIGAILVIAIASVGGFWLHAERAQKKRYQAELARVKALPLNKRLDELLRARRELVEARQHLASIRRAFYSSWGYRRNPYFSRLVIAEASYNAAHDWVKTVEELCNEPA